MFHQVSNSVAMQILRTLPQALEYTISFFKGEMGKNVHICNLLQKAACDTILQLILKADD